VAFGHEPGRYAPLSEFVGESPSPKVDFVHPAIGNYFIA
jgi:hypothetical protein